MKAYASGNKSGSYGAATKKGQKIIEDNMKQSGASKQKIAAVKKKALKNPNNKVTRVVQ